MSSSPSSSNVGGGGGMPLRSGSSIRAAQMRGYHQLKVEYFTSLGAPNGSAISSCHFMVGGRRWRIHYYPNGCNPEDADFISFFLVLDDSLPHQAMIQMLFTFDDEVRKQSQLGKAPVMTVSQGEEWGYARFVRKDELMTSKRRLKNDSCFTVRCDISVLTQLLAQDDEIFVSVPPSELRRQLGHMLNSGKGADVVFEVGGERFTAHRCLLAARSPVFGAALYGTMMEASGLGVIKINDMEPGVFKALLDYAYTDLVPEMDGEEGCAMSQHLFVAADRYGIERLKLICEANICKCIEVSNVMTMLILADQHQCSGLKNACFKFLKGPGKMQAALATEEYDHLKKTYLSLADEITDVLAAQI